VTGLRANSARWRIQRKVGTLIVYAASIALGLMTALAPPACTWSSACTDGRITTNSLPDATVGQGYSFQLTQSCGGKDAVSWQLVDGPPPPGMDLSWDGHLFGTPTTAGTFPVHLSLSLTSRGSGAVLYPVGSDSRAYTLTVRP
jgi:hypothetical protein